MDHLLDGALHKGFRFGTHLLCRVFERYDRDGDGRLQYNEMQKAIEQLLQGSEQPLVQKDYMVLFRTFDTNNTGSIDFKEFWARVGWGAHPEVVGTDPYKRVLREGEEEEEESSFDIDEEDPKQMRKEWMKAHISNIGVAVAVALGAGSCSGAYSGAGGGNGIHSGNGLYGGNGNFGGSCGDSHGSESHRISPAISSANAVRGYPRCRCDCQCQWHCHCRGSGSGSGSGSTRGSTRGSGNRSGGGKGRGKNNGNCNRGGRLSSQCGDCSNCIGSSVSFTVGGSGSAVGRRLWSLPTRHSLCPPLWLGSSPVHSPVPFRLSQRPFPVASASAFALAWLCRLP